MTKTPVDALHVNGVSAWLDDLSRDRIVSGNLSALKMELGIRGVTTNPSIFAAALTSAAYDEQLALLAHAGASASEAVFELTTTDVTMACEIFDDVFQDSEGVDGRVSIEVSPLVAHDSLATIAEARVLRGAVNRPNVLVKIPATVAGLEAITAVVAEGISVNVTLIFSLQRYEAVIDAYLAGLEQAHARGHDLSEIHSVASFFVSRVDTEVDRRLQSISTTDALSLISQAGLANARLAYDMSRRKFATARARALVEKGANVQRPLWASTGVKDPTLPDTMYVSGLVAPVCVNTMPEKTLHAFLDHGSVAGNTISPDVDTSRLYFERLSLAGVDFNDVTERLEAEGISKFVSSWTELLSDVEVVLNELR